MRKDKYALSLSKDQIIICIKAMVEFRNYAIEQDIDTIDIDKLIKKLSKIKQNTSRQD